MSSSFTGRKSVKDMNKRCWLIVLSAWALLACSKTPADTKPVPQLTAEQQARAYKFRGLQSVDLIVDGFGEKKAVTIFDDKDRVFISAGTFAPDKATKVLRSTGPLGVPKTLRAQWREGEESDRRDASEPRDYAKIENLGNGRYDGGTIVGDYTVEVASRIPDALLDDLRKNGGQFRLKLRVHDDGLLIGWDINRYPKVGEYNVAPEDNFGPYGTRTMSGGDFREAYIIGKILRPGWYMHPKTGQKMEMDF